MVRFTVTEILNYKGKTLVYWLIDFLQGVHLFLIFLPVCCNYFPVGCLLSVLFIYLRFIYLSINFYAGKSLLYCISIILSENNFVPFPIVTTLLSLSASTIPRAKLSDCGDRMMTRGPMKTEIPSLKPSSASR